MGSSKRGVMNHFDIGVIRFSYTEDGKYLQNIQVVQNDGHGNVEQLVLDREKLIDQVGAEKRVYLTRYLPVRTFNSRLPPDPYVAMTRIYTTRIQGEVFLKSTGHASACDDLGEVPRNQTKIIGSDI
jgi:hypothetical protein